MLVDLMEVAGALDEPRGTVSVNPRYVVQLRPGVNAADPDAQKFVTELTLDGGAKLRVAGAQSEVKCKLNAGRA